MRSDQRRIHTLTGVEPIPADLVVRLADSAIDHYEQLARHCRRAGEALWPPVEDPAAAGRAAHIAAAEFEATAASRDWTVPRERVQQLAADAIGLLVEGYVYDYDRDQARAASVWECLAGEVVRAEVPTPDRHAEALAESARGEPRWAEFAKWAERAGRAQGRGER
jgi:hypothetical protein